MTLHRATCEDCPWSVEDEDLLVVSDEADDHSRKEMHDVDIERAVATDGGVEGFGIESLEGELKTVLARHNELLTGERGDVEQAKAFAEIVAVVNAKMLQQHAEPDVQERSGVAHLEWPDEGVLSFVGNTADSEWLDNEDIDVSQFTHIHIKGGDL